jgi:hypothetical protein
VSSPRGTLEFGPLEVSGPDLDGEFEFYIVDSNLGLRTWLTRRDVQWLIGYLQEGLTRCCNGDTDGDGNCPRHSAPGVLRVRPSCTRCDGDGDGPSWCESNCPRCGGSGKEPDGSPR